MSGEEFGQKIGPFQRAVEERLRQANELYKERNAVYKDNFRIVGKVMQALFLRQPTLSSQQDFNRWHIFELFIVKLTRYATNWHKGGHEDSVQDMIVYLSILGELDKEWVQFHNSTEDGIKAKLEAYPGPSFRDENRKTIADDVRAGLDLDVNYLDRKAPGA